ncbi:hypothetical protein [Streptomyces sp. NPDC101776]|uniref:hypothetical protein n=1 Tax=Streptomyces sp. NPDC101776 TaxID=3366146 RepID=UPI003824C8B6
MTTMTLRPLSGDLTDQAVEDDERTGPEQTADATPRNPNRGGTAGRWPDMTTHTTRPADADQVAGETAAVDLVLAYLTGTVPAAPALSPLAADYMEQQASGLLSGAVRLDPGFSLHRRAVMPPAGLVWLESVAMSEPVAAAVHALAGDGADRFSVLSQEERVMALAISTAARLIALYPPAEAQRRLHDVRAVVSQP